MAAKKTKRRGSSKAGRKKLPGDRYPSGKLKPAGPCERVLANRRALIGDKKIDLSKASDPLDLAHAHGWLTDADHIAASRLLRVYRLAGFSPPHMGSAGLHEVQPALDIDMRPFSTMPHSEIVEIWDTVFNDEGGEAPVDAAKRAEERTSALGIWRTIMLKLSPDIRREVFDVCIARSWPQWVIWMAAGKEVPAGWDKKRERLLEGLEIVRSALRRPPPPKPPQPDEPEPTRPSGRKVVEELNFVDEHGHPVQMVCDQTGVPFSVARKVRVG